MVGAALALALARAGFATAMLELREPALAWDADGFDLRVSAITRASQQLLLNLGVWEQIRADRATPYEHMRVWDRAGLGEIRFDAADLAEPDLGHIVENRVIVRALWQALAHSDVAIHVPVALHELTLGEDSSELILEDGRRLRVRLVVGADGARSRVRELADIACRVADYRQQAVVATVHAAQGNAATAWQHFMLHGPLALLPVGEDWFSIVWSTTPTVAGDLCAISPGEFDQRLQRASEGRAGALALHGERAAFPLRLQHAQRYVTSGLALVGDAAHVIHPLAGQGVNLGFLDAGALVDVLQRARLRGQPLGALPALRRYERARRGHNAATQLAMDGFKHLFGNDSVALGLLRNAGLGLAGRLPMLRRQFARVALGHGIELPAPARPGWRPGPSA